MMQRVDKRLDIGAGWTLFLDRDGVINKKIDGGYVCTVEQFEWLPEVKDALAQLSGVFDLIVIVSNQQGVGKGVVSEDDLREIHNHLLKGILESGGRIDAIYYAPQLEQDKSPMRKPGIGMALAAKKDFPGINFKKSIMVGDSLSDMEFGKNAGMMTVAVTPIDSLLVDMSVGGIAEFANQVNPVSSDDRRTV